MKLYSAIIFDMDGVLVDSEPYHIKIERELFRKLKLDISEEEHARYMGTASDVMWTEIIRSRKLDLSVDEIVELNYRESEQYFSSLQQIPPMPGLVQLLDWATGLGIPMAVASSSVPEVVKIIMDKTGLRKYFKQVVSSRAVGKSKPEPDVFLHTAKLLSILPEQCIIIEDSTNGIKAAKAAGMFCIAYLGASSSTQNADMADLRIQDFYELKPVLKDMIS